MTAHAEIEASHGPALTVLTRTSAYYLAGHVCIGVRDRRSGESDAGHAALGLLVAGARPTCASATEVTALWPGAIRVGARMVLARPGYEHASEPVLATEPLSARRAAELDSGGSDRDHWNHHNQRDSRMKRMACVVLSIVSAGLLLSACGAKDPAKRAQDAGSGAQDAGSGDNVAAKLSCTGGRFRVDGVCKELTETWTRIEPKGETICSRGGPYSFFVHPGTNNKVLIYYAFGGFCYDAATCRNGAPNYVTHVDVDQNVVLATGGIMDLTNDENPFKDWNIVYVPDCTADFSTGNKVTEHPAQGGNPAITINHMGFVNVTAVHEWMYSNFLAPDRIVVSGSSGGGDAALMHYPYLRKHYGDHVKSWVMLLDSSFGIVPDEFYTTYSATWGMYDNRPSFIPAIKNASPLEMTQDFSEIAGNDYFPDGIVAELGSSHDILEGFTLSIMGGDKSTWPDKVQEHLKNVSAKADRFRSFVVAGTHHIIINQNSFYKHEINGRRMRDWVADLADGKDVESTQCTKNCSVNKVKLVAGPGQEVGIVCTGNVNCNQGEICCATLATQAADCAPACTPGQTQLCGEMADCGTGMSCRNLALMGVPLGICM
ncbi:MAG TPA: pectin acetylesterase-family hydrolase [Polyangiales bacterium]